MDVKKRSGLETRLLSKLWQKSLDNMFILKIINNDFYIVSTNDAQQETVNIEELEHLDKPLKDVLPKEIYDFVVPNYQRCIEIRSPIQYEESEAFTSDDGSISHWSTMLSPITNDAGEIDYIFGISRNITEIKNATKAAEELALKAEQANQVKTKFLANMSHEMRTPLNGIQCALELLKETDDKTEKSELISIIESSTEALSRQTNDILQYAKIGRGKISLQTINYSPEHLVHSVVKIISNSADNKGLTLDIKMDEQLPQLVSGDPDRIKQVLLNITNNAIKFTNQGSIHISLQHLNEKQQLLFSVKDTGIGIQESDQKKLFKPFSQVDDSSTRQFEGNGLGLVISKDLVQLMGGDIELTSTLTQGTTCQFSIPYQTASKEKQVTTKSQTLNLAGSSLLIVEDNPTNQIVLKKILSSTGAEITIAHHGKQALDLCHSRHFDILLMDWHMPVLDGLATTQSLRDYPPYAKTPILGLTASVMEEDIKTCIDSGMDDVITKPISREELFCAIAKHIKPNSSSDLNISSSA